MKRDVLVASLTFLLTSLVWAWAPWRGSGVREITVVSAEAESAERVPHSSEGKPARTVASAASSLPTAASSVVDVRTARSTPTEGIEVPERVQELLEEYGETVDDYRKQQEVARRHGDAFYASTLRSLGMSLTRDGDGRYPSPGELLTMIVEDHQDGRELSEREQAEAVNVLTVFLADLRRLQRSHRDAIENNATLPRGMSFRARAARAEYDIQLLAAVEPDIQAYLFEAEGRLEALLGPAPSGGFLGRWLTFP